MVVIITLRNVDGTEVIASNQTLCFVMCRVIRETMDLCSLEVDVTIEVRGQFFLSSRCRRRDKYICIIVGLATGGNYSMAKRE